MPIPAVYLPQGDLAPASAAQLNFAPIGQVFEGDGALPTARGLAADVSDPSRLVLFIVDPNHDRPVPGTVIRAAELAAATFTTPAPQAWVREAKTAEHLIIVTGPAPVLKGPASDSLVFTPGSMLALTPLLTMNRIR